MSIGGRGRSGYGSFFRSLLSPGFLNFPWQGKNRRQTQPLRFFRIDSVPSTTSQLTVMDFDKTGYS
ncbi:hypothetical protein [Paenibacillus sp. 7523-1]|uniref:hypothetical protein n=1 Tax=Paenibacillus sp. 7523-1 TaxID=2022550 RepID=UPI001C3ECC71|nr:hypothetical protein [Paenibacillus sp. 7523-1]